MSYDSAWDMPVEIRHWWIPRTIKEIEKKNSEGDDTADRQTAYKRAMDAHNSVKGSR